MSSVVTEAQMLLKTNVPQRNNRFETVDFGWTLTVVMQCLFECRNSLKAKLMDHSGSV